MGDLQSFFADLTGPQAELLSSAMTLLSALVVAVVAPLFFHLLTQRGVRSFQDSVADLRNAAASAREQSAGIRTSLQDVYKNVGELSVLLSSVQESVANTQNTLLEGRPNVGGDEDQFDGAPTDVRGRILAAWRKLQEFVEQAAASPAVNGNTRAKYARIDRRGYMNLVAALISDRNLGGVLSQWQEAYFIRNAARRSNAIVPEEDAARMARIVDALIASEPPNEPIGGIDQITRRLRQPPPRTPRRSAEEPTDQPPGT